MTTYQDAMIRKYTRNNPVMGFLANLLLQPNTGYMAHQMPRTIYYDPAQLNSLEVFSIYNDPFQKQDPKTDEEKDAMALQLLYVFQTYSVDELASQGFCLDYDTKDYMGAWLWDRIADLNDGWSELVQDGQTDYYVAGEGDWALGQQRVEELRHAVNKQIEMYKTFYYDYLWNDEFTIAKYNRRHTQYAQDANGEWYATGFYPNWFTPITLGPGESPGEYKYVMDREHDWQTESVVTGLATGERGLLPIEEFAGEVPRIESYSSDGTNTGHSKIYDADKDNGGGTDSGSPSGGKASAGYYPRRSGGGGGGSSAPNLYYRASAPNAPNATVSRRTNRKDADLEYLRPNFETKGSREAYKRSDI